MAKKTSSTPSSTPSQTPPPAIMPTANQSILLTTLRSDVTNFLTSWSGSVFFNENVLQRKLFEHLTGTRNYDKVIFEYQVHSSTFSKTNQLYLCYIDIVVRKNGEYALTELKFKTPRLKALQNMSITSFGITTTIPKAGNGAEKANRIAFWNDVTRIEDIINSSFYKGIVIGGLAVFVTNDHLYWKHGGANNLSIDPCNRGYPVNWVQMNNAFQFCIVTVP